MGKEVYIEVPSGYKYVAKKECEIRDRVVEKDCLVSKTNEKDVIPLQDIVKDSLQHKPRGTRSKTVDNLTIHFFIPHSANKDKEYLVYEHKNNASMPGRGEFKRLKDIVKFNPAMKTKNGVFWHDRSIHETSKTRRKRIKDKQAEQREDRRHTGDTPTST